MKKILVPCDFSKPAIEAYNFAISIASKTKGEVYVLHVIDIPISNDAAMMSGAYDPLFTIQMEDEAKRHFKNMIASSRSANASSTLKVTSGYTVPAIIDMIKLLSIDVVIMGTTGATGIYETFVGSTTEKVVRHSPVPVFAIRTAPDLSSVKKILLPTSLNFKETDFIIQVKELMKSFNASLEILLVNTPFRFKSDKEAKGFLKDFVNHYNLENYTLHVRNDYTEEAGIINFAREQMVDLIVMGTHARKGLSHFLNGSITEDVVNHQSIPMWTYCIGK